MVYGKFRGKLCHMIWEKYGTKHGVKYGLVGDSFRRFGDEDSVF